MLAVAPDGCSPERMLPRAPIYIQMAVIVARFRTWFEQRGQPLMRASDFWSAPGHIEEKPEVLHTMVFPSMAHWTTLELQGLRTLG